MKNFKSIVLLVSILGVAACGDNLSGLRPDAREQGDGPPMIDSPPGTPDANTTPDAEVTTVTVEAGACTGTPDHTLTVVPTQLWVFDGGTPAGNVDISVAAGDNIEFVSPGQHNFASVAPTGALSFRSGATGVHTACLTFTAAGGPADFHCEMHAAMTGTVTVTP